MSEIVAVVIALLGMLGLNYKILRTVIKTEDKVKSLPCVTGHVGVGEDGTLRLIEKGPRKLPMFNTISNGDVYDFNGGHSKFRR